MFQRPQLNNYKMQNPRGSPSKKMMKTQYLCIPRLRISNNSCTNKTKAALSPMTLLERFREAVLRFIMLSAVSNKTTNNHGAGSKDHVQRYYCPNDSHHSEAVADCIEFIKKKASPDDHDHNRGSSASASSSVDATADHEVVIPVLVM